MQIPKRRYFLIYLLTVSILCTQIAPIQGQAASAGNEANNDFVRIHPLLNQTDASDNYVVINGSGFAPAKLTIEVGDSVTWHNATDIAQSLYQGEPPDVLPETQPDTLPTSQLFLPIITGRAGGQSVVQQSSSKITSAQEDPPVSTLASGADFSQRFDQAGIFDFYLGADPTYTSQITVQERGPTSLMNSSPVNGAGDVAVTRETVLTFSHPVDPNSITDGSVYAKFGGEKLTAVQHLSPDGTKLTLFYEEVLPASARVRVTVDGELLRDVQGQAVDADGDGIAGGIATVDFDTLGIRMIPGTSVCGLVFASELGTDVSGGTQDVPLAGTTITVDGMETTLRTVTDNSGAFCLDPAPAGRFFVHIDGRTAAANVPAGAYYPFVGKAWEARAGTRTDVGNVYLPLVQPDTLHPVSQSEETMIHFAPTVLNEHPEFAEVTIVVPPDSLYANDGSRGGQVGIAPVPPDRLPGTLPPFLNFPLVITVQTDGATNFDTPAPVCFPNLPAPDSGELLSAGAKSALMSFNHDSGRWEVVGPMTVSDDGTLVCTDPGVGILAPGWHGTQDSTEGSGGNCQETDDETRFLRSASKLNDDNGVCRDGPDGDSGDPDEPDCPDYNLPEFWDVAATVATCASAILGAKGVLKTVLSQIKASVSLFKQLNKASEDYRSGNLSESELRAAVAVVLFGKESIKSAIDLVTEGPASPLSKLKGGLSCASSILELLEPICKSINAAPAACYSFVRNGACRLLPSIKANIDLANKFFNLITNSLRDVSIEAICNAADALIAYIDAPGRNQALRSAGAVDPKLVELLDALMVEMEPISEIAEEDIDALDGIVDEVEKFSDALGDAYVAENGPAPNAYVRIEYGQTVQRMRATKSGYFTFILPSRTTYKLSLLDPNSGQCGHNVGTSADSGQPTIFHGPVLSTCPGDDLDKDQLSAEAESIIGTDPAKHDTDGDGIPDGTEIAQGTNPLDGLLVETGIVATADTPGTALDVCVNDELIVVADGEAGLALFDAPSGQNPTLIAQVDTPGSAERVICPNAKDGGNSNLVAVANGASGLAIVDVTDPPAARILHQVDPGRPAGVDTVTALVRQGDVVYVGTNNAQIAAVDLLGGHVLLRGVAAGPVRDLAIQDDYLYVLTAKTLDVLALPTLQRLSTTPSPGTSTGRRLALAGDVAYVVRGSGYNTFDLANPAQPLLITSGESNQFGWKEMALNGSGLGVAAVGLNSTHDAEDHISLYAVSDPEQTDQFLTTIETPGVAYAVAIHDGLAYVADGVAGLHIINYQAYDAQGQPPSVNIAASADNNQIETGQWMDITANVADDVQARAVTFFVNGEAVATDRSFPFTQRMTAPSEAADTAFTVQAQAVDTGGNVGESLPLTMALVADMTPPQVLVTSPLDGAEAARGTTSSLLVLFDDPLDSATVTAEALKLFNAGNDGQLDTADDSILTGTVAHHPAMNAIQLRLAESLPVGAYRAEIGTSVQNQSGSGLASPYSWHFTVAPKAEVFWINPNDGDWNNGSNWHTGSPPAEIDDVYITMPGDYEVETASDFSVGSLTVGAGYGRQILDLTNRTITVTRQILLQPSGRFRTSKSVITGTATMRNESIFNLRKSSLMLPVDNVAEFNLWDQPTLLRGPIYNHEGGAVFVISTIGSNQRVNAHIEGDLYNDGLLEIQPTSAAFSSYNATLTISGTLENRATGLLRGARDTAHNRGIGILNGHIVNRGRIEAQGTVRIGGSLLDNLTSGILEGGGVLDIRSAESLHSGTISPGTPDAPIAKLTVRNALSMTTASTLNIEIGGLGAGTEHDQLVVEGDVLLSGVLNVDLVDGYEPAIGDTFEVITSSAITGAFEDVIDSQIGNGKRWNVEYSSTNVILEVVAE